MGWARTIEDGALHRFSLSLSLSLSVSTSPPLAGGTVRRPQLHRQRQRAAVLQRRPLPSGLQVGRLGFFRWVSSCLLPYPFAESLLASKGDSRDSKVTSSCSLHGSMVTRSRFATAEVFVIALCSRSSRVFASLRHATKEIDCKLQRRVSSSRTEPPLQGTSATQLVR